MAEGGGTKSEESQYDYLFKMLLIGDPCVGKSSLMVRFIDNVHTNDYATTIGVDFKTHTCDVDGTRVKLQIWDTAGHERFRAVTSGYYRGAHGVIIVFDITVRQSFENVKYWVAEISKYAPAETNKLLVGNKCDLEDDRKVSVDEAQRLASELGMEYVETSALNGSKVQQAFSDLARTIKTRVVQKPPARAAPVNQTVPIGNAVNSRQGGCCG